MSATNHYLALFLGSKTSARFEEWNRLSDDARQARQQAGIAAWKAWAEAHRAAIAEMGGPLGKTKAVSAAGVADVVNQMGAYAVVRAASHDEAARLFEGHPHFTIFPGDSVEIMPILPIPGGMSDGDRR